MTVTRTATMTSIGESALFLPRAGAFGEYGGAFVSELLRPALLELEEAMEASLSSRAFREEVAHELATWAGRPTPLTRADRLSREAGLEIWLKREDLLHGGAHKTNNVIGQALLARRMGKTTLLAETGAGQHGKAVALVAARLGLSARVYMGARDVERQSANVAAMEMLGAEVVSVRAGAATLREAINEALRDWTASSRDTHYLLGTVCGPHPFPLLVRSFQRVIGDEAIGQWSHHVGGHPDAVVACVGGGSNALGIFAAFLGNEAVGLIGVEPGGCGMAPGLHGAALSRGSTGILHGSRTAVLQDGEGQIQDAHSIAAGLDYPAVGPEHARLRDLGRARYVTATDEEALGAFHLVARTEGIIPALESAHALAFVLRAASTGELPAGARVLVNLSGRGEKDLDRVASLLRSGGGTLR